MSFISRVWDALLRIFKEGLGDTVEWFYPSER